MSIFSRLFGAPEPTTDEVKAGLVAVDLDAKRATVDALVVERREALINGEVGDAIANIDARLGDARLEVERGELMRDVLQARLRAAEERAAIDKLTAEIAEVDAEGRALAAYFADHYPGQIRVIGQWVRRFDEYIARSRQLTLQLIAAGTSDKPANIHIPIAPIDCAIQGIRMSGQGR